MKKTLLILAAVLICLAGYTQNRRPTPEKKFIYMTSIGYATGLGHIELENKTVRTRTSTFPSTNSLVISLIHIFNWDWGLASTSGNTPPSSRYI